jgi:hypothetical protein
VIMLMENKCAKEIIGIKCVKKDITVIFLAVSLTVLANTISSIESSKITISDWLFVIFFISFRVTIFIGDICTLNDNVTNWWAKIDFVLGLLLWFVWILAAIKFKEDLIIALYYIWAFLVISTIYYLVECIAWIFTFASTDDNRPKCYWRWIFINLAYIYFIPRHIFGGEGSIVHLFILVVIGFIDLSLTLKEVD